MRTSFAVGITAGLLVAAATTLPAQSTNTSPVPIIRPTSPGNAAGYAVGGPVGVLDEQQRLSYQNNMKEIRPKIMELESKLRAARQDLLDTSVTTKFDENVIREKAFAAAKIEAEMTVLRVKAFSEVQPPLTADQVQKIKASQQPAPTRPMIRPDVERPLVHPTPSGTNHDANGLPPKQ